MRPGDFDRFTKPGLISSDGLRVGRDLTQVLGVLDGGSCRV